MRLICFSINLLQIQRADWLSHYSSVVEYTKRWSALCKYPEKTVALVNSRYLEIPFEQAGEIYYHESCNKRYTDDVKVKRAKTIVVSSIILFPIHCKFLYPNVLIN